MATEQQRLVERYPKSRTRLGSGSFQKRRLAQGCASWAQGYAQVLVYLLNAAWRKVAQAGRNAMRRSFWGAVSGEFLGRQLPRSTQKHRVKYFSVSLPGVARRKVAQAWRKVMRKLRFSDNVVM